MTAPHSALLRASVTADSSTATGSAATVLVDGADTACTANGLADYAPTPGDRLLVQKVGGAPHRARIAVDHGRRGQALCEASDDDLGSDARGIAHGDAQGRGRFNSHVGSSLPHIVYEGMNSMPLPAAVASAPLQGVHAMRGR